MRFLLYDPELQLFWRHPDEVSEWGAFNGTILDSDQPFAARLEANDPELFQRTVKIPLDLPRPRAQVIEEQAQAACEQRGWIDLRDDAESEANFFLPNGERFEFKCETWTELAAEQGYEVDHSDPQEIVLSLRFTLDDYSTAAPTLTYAELSRIIQAHPKTMVSRVRDSLISVAWPIIETALVLTGETIPPAPEDSDEAA